MKHLQERGIAGFVLLCGMMLALSGPMALADNGKKPEKEGPPPFKEAKILEFDTMVGVPRPYTGAANAIRGVAGGGLPWIVDRARGELRLDGFLRIKVEGLVFDPTDQAVIDRGIANQNTVASFRAIVSCLSKDSAGAPVTVNRITDAFPATLGFASQGGGNADIQTYVDLPRPCIAPIIFVTSPGGAWFASTGF